MSRDSSSFTCRDSCLTIECECECERDTSSWESESGDRGVCSIEKAPAWDALCRFAVSVEAVRGRGGNLIGGGRLRLLVFCGGSGRGRGAGRSGAGLGDARGDGRGALMGFGSVFCGEKIDAGGSGCSASGGGRLLLLLGKGGAGLLSGNLEDDTGGGSGSGGGRSGNGKDDEDGGEDDEGGGMGCMEERVDIEDDDVEEPEKERGGGRKASLVGSGAGAGDCRCCSMRRERWKGSVFTGNGEPLSGKECDEDESLLTRRLFDVRLLVLIMLLLLLLVDANELEEKLDEELTESDIVSAVVMAEPPPLPLLRCRCERVGKRRPTGIL